MSADGLINHDNDDGEEHEPRVSLDARLARLEAMLSAQDERIQSLEAQLRSAPPPSQHINTDAPPSHAARQSTQPVLDAAASATGRATPDFESQRAAPVDSSNVPLSGASGVAFPRHPDLRGRVYGDSKAQGARSDGGATAANSTTGRSARSWFDLEAHVGGSWFSWLGILAVAFGVAFFLKYAFESDWVGPAGRVLLGAAAGFGLLAAGERLRRRGPRSFAHTLTGGGVLVLYLAIYAAYDFYQLVGQTRAFLLMAAVTALAVLLAWRHDALTVAVLALVGGFVTPPLLASERDNQIALFTYVALLDAGVLALAYLKNWRLLNHLSFAATALTTLGWLALRYTPAKLTTTLFFLSLFFLLYALLPLVHHVLPQRRARWFDLSLLAANATVYFGLGYALLEDAARSQSAGALALCVSAFYLLLYYAAHRRAREDRLLVYGLLGAAVTFFTAAVAIQLELHWVTITWAAEACALAWVALRAGEPALRRASFAVLAVASTHWLTHDLHIAPDAGALFVPLLNSRALSCAALVAACVLVACLSRSWRGEQVSRGELEVLTATLAVGASALVLLLLMTDANEYFTRRAIQLGDAAGNNLARLRESKQFTFSALWTIYGAGLLAFGVARGFRSLRAFGLLLLMFAALKIAFVDISNYDATWHTPLLNQTFFAFALLVAALALVAQAYARFGGRVNARERAFALSALVVAAHLFALVALSAEARGYFGARMKERIEAGAGGVEDLQLAAQLSLSVVWALYGGAMLAYGHARQNSLLRLLALGLLALTTVKVFLLDLAALERIYRIVSFLVLGLILLAVSYLYQRSRQQQQ